MALECRADGLHDQPDRLLLEALDVGRAGLGKARAQVGAVRRDHDHDLTALTHDGAALTPLAVAVGDGEAGGKARRQLTRDIALPQPVGDAETVADRAAEEQLGAEHRLERIGAGLGRHRRCPCKRVEGDRHADAYPLRYRHPATPGRAGAHATTSLIRFGCVRFSGTRAVAYHCQQS